MIKIKVLQEYLREKKEVLMAFIFGSFVRGQQTEDSDIDIAIYLKPEENAIEMEEKHDYPVKNEIWRKINGIMKRDTDLVILNQAYPSFALNVIKSGIPLVIKDVNLYREFYDIVERETEDFIPFMEDYLQIKIAARSLTKEARISLMSRFDYLLTYYYPEKDRFLKLDFATYKNDNDQRRIIERWVENIANCTLDIAKIVLASEKKEMPKSYKDVLFDFGMFLGLKAEEAENFSGIAELRNILAHEYLDILYSQIRNFLDNLSPFYEKLFAFLKDYLKKNTP